jgi:hypothetical protein
MTSEPDSTPRRRPPTIDLTAKEVETGRQEPAADAPDPTGDRAPQDDGAGKRRQGSLAGPLRPYALAAAAGAIGVAAIVAGLWYTASAPSRGGAPQPAMQAPNRTAVDEISARLDKIQVALQGRQADTALANRVATAEAEAKALSETLAALNRRLDDIAVTARSALAHADAAAAAADAAKSAAQANLQRGDLDALANRIAALERTVKSLTDDVARHTTSADDRAARTTVAAEALRAVVERGAPYQAELAAMKSLGVEQSVLAPLEPFAAEGLPSTAALARELAALSPALLRAAGAAPGEGTFLGRMEMSAQKLVRITPVEAPPGDDAAAVLARSNAAVARGDIAAALAEIARLPDAARSLAEPWTKKAQAREGALAASRRIAADALVTLARPAAQ